MKKSGRKGQENEEKGEEKMIDNEEKGKKMMKRGMKNER